MYTVTRYLNFCMHFIHLILHHDIKPVVVFDGANLPMKAAENKARARSFAVTTCNNL